MKILKEQKMDYSESKLIDDELEVEGAAPPAYKDAIETHKKNKKDFKDKFKGQEKEIEDFVKGNHNTDFKPKQMKELHKMHLSESLFDEETTETVSNTDRIFYRNKRKPLADIIQLELTDGERVYKLNDQGSYVATKAPALNMDGENIGANSDINGDYIIARVATEAECAAVENIARKYNREFKSGFDKFISGNKYYTKIYLKDEDWDVPYVDPKAQVRVDGRKKTA